MIQNPILGSATQCLGCLPIFFSSSFRIAYKNVYVCQYWALALMCSLSLLLAATKIIWEGKDQCQLNNTSLSKKFFIILNTWLICIVEAPSETCGQRGKEWSKTYGSLLIEKDATANFWSYLGKSFSAWKVSLQVSLKNHLELHAAPWTFKHKCVQRKQYCGHKFYGCNL